MGGWTKSFMAGRLVNATVDEGESDMDSGALCHDNRLTIRPDDPST